MPRSYKEEEPFAAALALPKPEQLQYLERACADDAALFDRRERGSRELDADPNAETWAKRKVQERTASYLDPRPSRVAQTH